MSQEMTGVQAVIARFVKACQEDPRVLAATLYGSRASGAEDAHSDIDLAVVTSDAAFDSFMAERGSLVQKLGNPLFIEDFDIPDMLFVILDDGTEIELALGRESKFSASHGGPYRVLLDKRGILAGAAPAPRTAEPAEQVETLRRLIAWFWHDLSHFITATARGQLWWAEGQLSVLRLSCINLARLRQDFSDPDADEDGFFKVDQILPAAALAPLAETYCPLEAKALINAAGHILRFYRELAQPLAQEHGLAYPTALDEIMTARLQALITTR